MSLDMLTVVVSAINVGLHTGAPAFFMRNAAWALSNFFWGTPPPDVSALEPAIPAVMALLDHKDREVRAEALWASAHFANGGDDRIQASIDSGLFSKVLSELGRQDPETQGPCLRMVDIVLTGTVSHVKRAVEAGVVPLLLGALESARGIALRDACRGISRVAAMGNEEYTEVLARSPFIMRLYEILVSSSNTGIDNDGETRAEVGWIFANIATYTTEKQLSQLDLKTLTNALGKCATIRDSQLINAAVSGIERVLEMGEHAKDCGTFRTNPVLEWLREVGAFEAIKALESHPRREIAQRCSDLVTRYFCGASNFEDESEDVVLS